jgi:hypothetical protein
MCLLTKTPNRDLASGSFDEKKAIYAKSKIILTNQLVNGTPAGSHGKASHFGLAVSMKRWA